MTALNSAGYLGRGAAEFVGGVVRSRRLILDLTRREFRGRYLGTAFGLIWAFIHPTVLTLIYWCRVQVLPRRGRAGRAAEGAVPGPGC